MEINLRDLYRDPNGTPRDQDDNESIWVEYSPPVYFINVYPPIGKRRRRRLIGKMKRMIRDAKSN